MPAKFGGRLTNFDFFVPTNKEALLYCTAISHFLLAQVSNWFANARRRLKNVVQEQRCSWSKRLRLYNQCVQVRKIFEDAEKNIYMFRVMLSCCQSPLMIQSGTLMMTRQMLTTILRREVMS